MFRKQKKKKWKRADGPDVTAISVPETTEVDLDALNRLSSGHAVGFCTCRYAAENGCHVFTFDHRNAPSAVSIKYNDAEAKLLLTSLHRAIWNASQSGLAVSNIIMDPTCVFRGGNGFLFLYLPVRMAKDPTDIDRMILDFLKNIKGKHTIFKSLLKTIKQTGNAMTALEIYARSDNSVTAETAGSERLNKPQESGRLLASEEETTVLSQARYDSEGETTVLSQARYDSEGETTVLSQARYDSEGETTVLSQARYDSEGETTVLSQARYDSEGETTVLSQARYDSEGETTVLSQARYDSEGETTVLSQANYDSEGETTVLSQANYDSEGETTVLSQARYDSEGETTVLSNKDAYGYEEQVNTADPKSGTRYLDHEELSRMVKQSYAEDSREKQPTLSGNAFPEYYKINEAPHTHRQTVQVFLVSADNRGKYEIAESGTDIGTLSGSGRITLRNSSISRRHAGISIDRNRVFVTDYSSTNGTFMDGVEITPGQKTEVYNGSFLSFGNETFQILIKRVE